jgi:hypothetical protein
VFPAGIGGMLVVLSAQIWFGSEMQWAVIPTLHYSDTHRPIAPFFYQKAEL